MSTKGDHKENKFLRYMNWPIKTLSRARDFYVQSLTSCAGHTSAYGATSMAMPAPPQFGSFSRSFSPSSAHSRDEDLRELIRFASKRSLARKQSPEAPGGGDVAAVKRSRTVSIGRIDEEKPCEFDGVGELPEVYPRSRSYAAPRGRASMV